MSALLSSSDYRLSNVLWLPYELGERGVCCQSVCSALNEVCRFSRVYVCDCPCYFRIFNAVQCIITPDVHHADGQRQTTAACRVEGRTGRKSALCGVK